MLAKYIGTTVIAMASFSLAWTGCSSDDATIPPRSSDAGGGIDASESPPPVDPAAGQDASTTPSLSAGEVTFSYGTCPAATPCGGDPQGTWNYSAGGCIAELTTAQCSGFVVKKSFVKSKGTITIGATTLKRDVTASITATVELPTSCGRGFPCSLLGIGLKLAPPDGPGFDTANCKDSATPNVCECEVAKTATEKSETTYTVEGNTISTADNFTYDYCVQGNKMTYRDKFQSLVDANIVMTK
jgi:hypothetical protein